MVDIIIPIYNAYDDLVKCIDSVKKWTNLSDNRLILIDDCSPDERMRPYLNSLKDDNTLVIFNEKNQGFSGNINLGMMQSQDNDVLLLNSDTIVTKRWLEKIVECAYSDEAIATVTPLSNNATLCSVPNFCEENTIPEGFTIDSFADLIETISMNLYPVIPVANGFCMFVKREIIRKIGMFDAETFGRGYGEENDFCHRAEQIGYHHVMCDNTFIFHSGTSSFLSEEKKRYIEEHDKILKERYPDQVQKVAEHCRDNPNSAVFENVKVFSGLRCNNRQNILYLVQSDFREGASDNVGGTQLHVKDLTMGLRDTYNIFVAARDYNYLNVTGYIGEKEYFFKFYIGEKPKFPIFYDKKMADLYGQILEAFRIDVVHIHHTYGLTLDLYKQAHIREIPLYVTLHDYYSICPTIKMLDQNNELCIGADSEERCIQCLNRQQDIAVTVSYIKNWREEYGDALKMAESIIVPSESARNIILSYYPFLTGKICVIEHGSHTLRRIKREGKNSKFHVAFLGGISPAKGSEYAFQMIKNGDTSIEWYLFGMFGHNDLSMMNRKNFHKIGGYEREELPDLMEKYQIDLVCILPIWPETFCYTISESILCGIPVLATDIGAVGERVKTLGCGWVVPHQASYQEILKKIEEIRNNQDEYDSIWKQVNELKLKTAEEMVNEYKKAYQKCDIRNRAEDSYDKKIVLNGYLWANDLGGFSEADADLNKRLNEAEKRIQAITSSITFKTVQALAGVKIPCRKQIKSLLYKMYGIIKR